MSPSGAAKSQRLLPFWAPIAVAGVIGTGLYSLFPAQPLEQRLAEMVPDQASMAYLRALVAAQPENVEARRALAEQHRRLQRYSQALDIVQPLLALNNQDRLQTQLQALALKREYFYSLPSNAPERSGALRDLLQGIRLLAQQPIAISELERLAQWCMELEQPTLAAEIYGRLVDRTAGPRAFWRNPGAPPLRLASSDWRVVAADIRRAIDAPKQTAESYALRELDALLAANEGAKALRKAEEYIDRFPASRALLDRGIRIALSQQSSRKARDWGRRYLLMVPENDEALAKQFELELAADDANASLDWLETYAHRGRTRISRAVADFAVRLALAGGKTARARDWGARYIAAHPNDEQALERQLGLELGVGNLPRALAIGRSLVGRRPKDIELRRRVARVAEWAGQPRLALTHWARIAHTGGSEEAFIRAVTLARQLHEFNTIAELLVLKSKQSCLHFSEINELVDAQEALGEPESAVGALQAYLKCHPEKRLAWERLTVLYERMGNLEEALAVQDRIARRFPADGATIAKRAELLWQLNQPSVALGLLRRHAANTPAEHSAFWELYASLAWELGADRDAQQAYRVLWQSHSNDSRNVERLLPLIRASGGLEFSLKIAEQAWRKFHKPAYLIAAMEAAHQAQLWAELRRLEGLALDEPRLFEGIASFWLLRGALAAQDKQPERARIYYQQALGLAPYSTAARTAMLWLLIEQGANGELGYLLQLWRTAAAEEPALWGPFAIGYRQVGLTREALSWYGRQAAQQPHDYLWLLEYADALEEAGARSRAEHLRRDAMDALKPAALEQLRAPRREPATEVFLRRYGGLLRQYVGNEVGERWLQALTAGQQPTAEFQEFLVGWYLGTDRSLAARHYLLRAHAHRLQLPNWQQLAVALDEGDQDALERILGAPDGLTVADRVETLRRLGHLDHAYAMANQHLGALRAASEQTSLRQQASELAAQRPNGASGAVTLRNLGTLTLTETPLRLINSRGRWGMHLEAGWVGLGADPTKLDLSGADSEASFEAVAWRGWRRSTSTLALGANLREDQSLFPVSVTHEHRFPGAFAATASLAFNELSEDSAAFRAAGKRHRLTLGLFGEPTRREYFSATLNGLRYLTRSGTKLGSGMKVDLEVGHRVWMVNPEWKLSVYGTSTWNDLRPDLPPQLAAVLPANAGIGSVLAETYRELGFKASWQKGEMEPLGHTAAGLHYLLGAGLFWRSPPSGIGYRLDAGIGARVLGADDLTLSGFFSGSQGGVETEPSMGIGLRYSLRYR